MEFSWIRYLLDNAASSGSRVESHAGVHVAIHPYISWPVFNWAIVEPLRSGDAGHALEEASNALSSAGRGLSVLVPENEKWLERGVHAALFAARISRGMSLGARCFATETAGPPVIRVAEKWGFKERLRFRYWFR